MALSSLFEDRKMGSDMVLASELVEHRGHEFYVLTVNGELGSEYGHNRLKYKYKHDQAVLESMPWYKGPDAACCPSLAKKN